MWYFIVENLFLRKAYFTTWLLEQLVKRMRIYSLALNEIQTEIYVIINITFKHIHQAKV